MPNTSISTSGDRRLIRYHFSSGFAPDSTCAPLIRVHLPPINVSLRTPHNGRERTAKHLFSCFFAPLRLRAFAIQPDRANSSQTDHAPSLPASTTSELSTLGCFPSSQPRTVGLEGILPVVYRDKYLDDIRAIRLLFSQVAPPRTHGREESLFCLLDRCGLVGSLGAQTGLPYARCVPVSARNEQALQLLCVVGITQGKQPLVHLAIPHVA